MASYNHSFLEQFACTWKIVILVSKIISFPHDNMVVMFEIDKFLTDPTGKEIKLQSIS